LPPNKLGYSGCVESLEAAVYRVCSQDRPSSFRRLNALQVLAAQILKLKEIAKELARAVADDDHVWGRDALQPCGKVWCLANDGLFLRSARANQVAYDHQAGRNAYAGLKRLVDIVGASFAKEIFYTARQFDAQEAYAMGLVNRVVPQAELESYVKSLTDMISANAPLTIKAAKFAVGEILKNESKRDIARVDAMVEACFASRDYVEGRTAFMEKRKPSFTGK